MSTGSSGPVASGQLGAPAGSQGLCTLPGGELSVAAAPEIADVVTALTRSGAAGCTVTVDSVDPATVIAAKATGVDVWIPDSSMWLDRATASGIQLPPTHPVIATSPVVFALSSTAAAQLSAAEGTPETARILESRRTATPIRVGLPDPRRSAASVGAILAARAAVAGAPDARAALTWAVRSSPPQLPVDGGELLDRLSSDPGTAVPVSEQEVVRHNRAQPGTAVQAVYQVSGGVALDYPVVVLAAGDAEAAASALVGVLTEEAASTAFLDAGFRSSDGRPGGALGSVAGIDPDVRVTSALPGGAAVDDAIRTAQLTNEPSRMLAVMDISGSMESQVPGADGASRMDLAKAAATRGLGLYGADSDIGLWVFSRKIDGDSDHRELIPVSSLGDDGSGSTGAQRLAQALGGIQAVPEGGTGLYDTVLDAVRAMRAGWDQSKVNAVLVLSDGVNDDEGSISLDQLLGTLAAEQDRARPVTVISIAFGPESDVEALSKISAATGGVAYQSRDPNQIGEIFLDAVGQRLCRPGC